MGFRLAFYDANEVAIMAGGVLLDGYADGEFCTAEMMTDAFTSVVGSNGEVARSKTNDRRMKVTIKLLQTSQSNKVLSALHNVDINTPNGGGITTLQVQDLTGGSRSFGGQAWIVKYPDSGYDREAGEREWVFECAVGDRIESGN